MFDWNEQFEEVYYTVDRKEFMSLMKDLDAMGIGYPDKAALFWKFYDEEEVRISLRVSKKTSSKSFLTHTGYKGSALPLNLDAIPVFLQRFFDEQQLFEECRSLRETYPLLFKTFGKDYIKGIKNPEYLQLAFTWWIQAVYGA